MMSVDLSTTYLGLKLKNPLVVSACPMSQDAILLRQLEDAGAAAAVLPSLFEEQIDHDAEEIAKVYEFGTDSYAEALTYFPEEAHFNLGPEEYLESIAHAKKAVDIPIIGSLNGVNRGGWIRYAKLMEQAGADAVELNIYFVATDANMTSEEVESQYVDLVASVKQSISIPLAVKIGPSFSAMANMGVRLSTAGADGLVLFNRFYQPDIDLESMEIRSRFDWSSPGELSIALRWIALLYGRTRASLAATGGIYDAAAMLKAVAAGADVGMVASTLYRNGIEYAGRIVADMQRWLEDHEYKSIEQLKGSMSSLHSENPTAFQRGNYMKTLVSCVGRAI
jgi:dihydroorotate dehydrogenase (fumarate)